MKNHSVDDEDDADNSSLPPSIALLNTGISQHRDEGYMVQKYENREITGSIQKLLSTSGLGSGLGTPKVFFFFTISVVSQCLGFRTLQRHR